MSPYRAHVDCLFVDPYFPLSTNRYHDVSPFFAHRRLRRRPIDVDTSLLDERGRYDEEDQEDEDHVDERCQVDTDGGGCLGLRMGSTHRFRSVGPLPIAALFRHG